MFEDEEEIKSDFRGIEDLTSASNIMAFQPKNNTGISSFRYTKKHSRLNMSTVNEPSLPSVSAVRNNDNRSKKSTLLKELKKRHPKSRLFKAEGYQDQYRQGIFMLNI